MDKDEQHDLRYYVQHNDLEHVQQLLEQGCDLSTPPSPVTELDVVINGKKYFPLIFLAVMDQSHKMLELLLNFGADPHEKTLFPASTPTHTLSTHQINALDYILICASTYNLFTSNPQGDANANKDFLTCYALLRDHLELSEENIQTLRQQSAKGCTRNILFQQWEEELLMRQQNARILESLQPCNQSHQRRM